MQIRLLPKSVLLMATAACLISSLHGVLANPADEPRLAATTALDPETYFRTDPHHFTRGAMTGRSCAELADFFSGLASRDQYPCGPEVREHKEALFHAIARCLSEEGSPATGSMEELIRRELNCDEPTDRVLSVLRLPHEMASQGDGIPPASHLLPVYLDAYHSGSFPHAWPVVAAPRLRDGGMDAIHRENAAGRLIAYVNQWAIEEPALALQCHEEYLEDGDPRKLMSAMLLADRELFADFLGAAMAGPELDFPEANAQVVLAALSQRAARRDHRLFLDVMPARTRQDTALWIIEQARIINPDGDRIEQQVEDYTGDLTGGEYRMHLAREQYRSMEALRGGIVLLPLLINEAKPTEEELAKMDDDPAMARELAFRADPELREAIEQASNSAVSPQVRRHFSELVESINQAEQR